MRQQAYLRHRYQALISYMGQLFIIIGVLHLAPLLLLPFYPQEAQYAVGFLLASLPLIGVGLIVRRKLNTQESFSLTLQEGSVVVLTIWVVATLAASIPFMVIVDLSFAQAIFEATSGWTTTGLSVVDVTTAPAVILFFRSFIQLAGGAGFAIIALSAGAGGGALWGLVAAEGRTDQLAPHVRQSAGIVLRMYGAYIVVGIVALRAAGMNWFDSVNHAFTALATGGFSTRPESIGHWDSALVEAVICVLMIMGALNFLTAYTLFRGRFDVVRRNGEVRLAALAISVSVLLLILIVTAPLYGPEKAIRAAVFETVSALSGTGFTSVDHYHTWSDFGWLVLIVLMSLGGGTGSTSGGIKQLRVYILYKSIVWEIKRAFMPQHMVNEPAIWQGDKRGLLNDRQVRQTALFFGMYLTVLLAGSGVLLIYGYSLKESIFEFASSLGTVGLTVGVTRSDMPPFLLLLQSLGMLLGRLEIFAVIIGSFKLFGDARTILSRRKAEARDD